MKLTILCLMVVLAGCMEARVEYAYIEQAMVLCKENEGIKSIVQRKAFLPNYTCNNGVIFEIYNDRITKITPAK